MEWKRANSRPRVASLSINKDKMLNGGHLDLNSIQFCSDSLKERLKQTMLNQELVFMGQVLELHRLYKAQAAMAEDSKRRGLDHYNSHIRGVNSSPVNLNNQVKSFMSGIQCTTPGSKQNPLDLQLSADDFIRQSAIGSKNRNTTAIDLNLSLTSGEETSKKGGHRSRMGKGACAPPPEIIDLEDPNLVVSNYDVNLGVSSVFSASISSAKKKNVFERSVVGDKPNSQSFSKSGVRHVSNGATSSRPFINVDQTFQNQTLHKSGLNKDFLASDTSIPHNKPMTLDLNTIQLDDLSNANSDVFNSLAGTGFSSSGRELNVNNCAETPDILVQNNLKSGNKISIERNKPEDNRGKEIIIIDLDSDSDSGEELCSSGSDPKIESVGSSSKLSDELLCGSEMREAIEPKLGLEKDPKPFFQNVLVTESLDSNTLCSKSKIESGGSSSKLSNKLLFGFEMGGAVVPELAVEKDPKPFCQNVLGTESLDSNTLCPKSKIESMGSSSKSGLLCGFETGGAVVPELAVEKDPKPFCQNVFGTESLDSNTLCPKSKIESIGSSSKSGLLCGFETGGAVVPELAVEKDPKPFCQNVLGTESLDSNTLCPKSKIESMGSSSKSGLLCSFEMGEADVPELGLENNPKPFCENVLVSESLDLNTLCSKSKIESRGSSSKLLNGPLCGFEMARAVGPESGLEKDPKPFGQSVLVTESLDSYAVCSNRKIESMGSSSKLSNGLLCGFEMGGAVGPESGVEKDPKPFCQNVMVTESLDSNTLCSKNKELEVDEMVQKAAELLVQMSLGKQDSDRGYLTKSDSNVSSVQTKVHDRPQWSLDSYEVMVLDAKECGPEDYCVSSNAFVVDVTETDSRYKLKRGTRMKDFQKDILSSLSTLSRHEIREDINIFEGVIRSREYKRMRAKMADDDDWVTPKKSRRSKISRRYS